MARLAFADRLLKGARRLLPEGQLLKERLVVRPLKVVGPFLKQGLVMRPLLIAFIVIGAVLVLVGVRQYSRTSTSAAATSGSSASASASSAKIAEVRPREITCNDLAAMGPGNSDYVRLTDFEFTDHSLHRSSSSYVSAVPLRRKDSPSVRPHKVLVKTTTASGKRELYELGRGPIEGTIVKGIGSLTSEEQAVLRKNFSHMDLNACWIIEAGNKPAPRTPSASAEQRVASAGGGTTVIGGGRSGLGLIGGGAVLAAGALVLSVRRA
jgi:hypothetical protein